MLPVNFHKTFMPERRLIGALLNYAALGREGNFKEISAETGIPMGESSGKVPAIFDYAKGMGLIEVNEGSRKNNKKPVLTDLGRTVYVEDKYISEEIIQWLAHMNLCRSDIGAITWNALFAKGRRILGNTFSKGQLETYLSGICGSGRDRTGPLLSTYTEDAALARAGIITIKGDEIKRKRAPLLDAYAIPYSAYILSLMEAFFPGEEQVTLSDFQDKTYCFDICFWGLTEIERLFSLLERKGYLSVDRQMHPWIIEKKASANEVWPHIWDDIA